jgi:hypothetical protein
VDVRLGPLEFRHHPGQRFGTVDQDVERSSRARLRVAGSPVTPWSIKCYQPADPLEPAAVVRTDGAANGRSQVAVSTKREIGGHGRGSSHASTTPTRRALEVAPRACSILLRDGFLDCQKHPSRNAALRLLLGCR